MDAKGTNKNTTRDGFRDIRANNDFEYQKEGNQNQNICYMPLSDFT